MYTTKHQKEDKITVEGLKPRNKRLHDILSGRRGGRMQDKRKSRAAGKQELRNSKDFQ